MTGKTRVQLNHPQGCVNPGIKKSPTERTNWRRRCPPSSWSEQHHIKRRPPGNHGFNKRRVPSSVSSGPSNRKMNRRESSPARLKQLQTDQVSPEYQVPVHHEDQWQPRKNFSGPDESSQGGQVLITYGADNSTRKDKSSPRGPVPVHQKKP
ncbi:hypothetical protein TNIN_406811 [Trichonephila inaurata madagascariensis]|uniref:Uncharacterized protein n=1 Tax=Trichonephila inaurata madagascariensis TaxID=2747483 RepID=A0A8X6XS40_9ARAC|nr:hypothetical protein TNIN_406811 [Trichonephila inaurata madagascariensis]